MNLLERSYLYLRVSNQTEMDVFGNEGTPSNQMGRLVYTNGPSSAYPN